jgi:hypothetical protein
VVGSAPLGRGQVVSKMWEYIRSHNLQNPENRREILASNPAAPSSSRQRLQLCNSAVGAGIGGGPQSTPKRSWCRNQEFCPMRLGPEWQGF